MSLDWVSWSNPLAVWWVFLVTVSVANIAVFLLLQRRYREGAPARRGLLQMEFLLLLCAAYVFGCAFRSVLPRADIQRICLFDTWLSSVFVGRSIATVAELCFAAQWAIVLRCLAILTRSDTARNISSAVVPLIVMAECCSWYAVITTNYLGNAIENSLWAVAFLLIAGALVRLLIEFQGRVQLAIGIALAGIAGYLVFLFTVDVPMYFERWQADVAAGKTLFGIVAGLHDASTHWVATHDLAQWEGEMTWMALYFSLAVWSSLVLGGFGLVKDHLPRYRRGSAQASPANWRLPVSASAPEAPV